MTDRDRDFDPEVFDGKDLEQRLNQLMQEDAQLVQELRKQYRPTNVQYTNTLKHAWERIQQERQSAVGHSAQKRRIDEPVSIHATNEGKSHMHTIKSNPRKPTRLRLVLNILTAAALLTAIAFVLGRVLGIIPQAQTPAARSTVHQQQNTSSDPLFAISGLNQPNGTVISRLDLVSGDELWHFPVQPTVDKKGEYASEYPVNPHIVNGILFFGDTDTKGEAVYAVNVTTGVLVWETPLAQSDESLIVANGLVYSGESSFGSASILALDAQNGQQIWKKTFAASGTNVIDDMQVVGATSNVVYAINNRLAQQQSLLYALDQKTGNVLWHKEIAHAGEINTEKMVGNTLYMGTTGFISAYDLSTGTQLWSTPVSVGFVDRIEVEQNTLYATTSGKLSNGSLLPGSFYALLASNGSVLWQQQPQQFIDAMFVSAGEVYLSIFPLGGAATHGFVGSDGTPTVTTTGPSWHLQAFKGTNGHLDWQQTIPATTAGTSVIVGSNLYMTGLDDTIHVLDLSNGKQTKTINVSETTNGSLSKVALFTALP